MEAVRSLDLSAPCAHAAGIRIHTVTRGQLACEECLKMGAHWVQLRECLACGHIGCCDSSPNKHATAHFLATRHPIVTSAEPGETWCWCYLDRRFLNDGE
jgi:hypothetical protein